MENVKSTLEMIGDKVQNGLETVSTVTNNEHFQLAGDVLKVLGVANTLIDYASQKKFEMFLRGLSIESTTEKQLIKLNQYINNQVRAEYIADSFRKILLSNSSNSCLIMGGLLGDIIDSEREFTHKELICISAILDFVNYDYNNFKNVICYINEQASTRITIGPTSDVHKVEFNFEKIEVYSKRKGIDYSSLKMSLSKIINSHLLIKVFSVNDPDYDEGVLYINSFSGSYEISEAGELLIEYMEKMGL